MSMELRQRSNADAEASSSCFNASIADPLQLRNSIIGTLPTKSSKLAKFYKSQDEQIERLLKPVHDHVADARESADASATKYQIAVYASLIANVCLAILQVYGAVSSGSLSLFTTMADSIFDPCSNIMLIVCNRAVARVDPRKYPAGKARIETAGNIGFCFLMTAVSILLIAFSAQELSQGSNEATKGFHYPAVIAVGVAFVTKLALFLYCYSLRNSYSQISILWQDHRNDLLINGFGLLTSVGGSKLRWWIDPTGAIVLSLIISFIWLRTASGEFNLLIGKSADPKTLQHITYLAMTHDPSVSQVDTVRAWHTGPRLAVEVDIVMDPDCTLRVSHDVAESLQMKIESLPDVDRANVHVDYETTHKPEHFLKKEL